MGNLLLDITATGLGSTGSTYFDMSSSTTDGMSRLFDDGRLDSIGLVTGFNEVSVPEPSSMGLLALGLIGLAYSRRNAV